MEPEQDQEPRFEDDLRALEDVVDELERGDGGLATALARYEQGVKLLVRCQTALEKAERSVALLTGVNPDGTPVTVPFDATATAPGLGTAAPAPPVEPSPAPRKRSPRTRTTMDKPATSGDFMSSSSENSKSPSVIQCPKCGTVGRNHQPPEPDPDSHVLKVPYECPNCGHEWVERISANEA